VILQAGYHANVRLDCFDGKIDTEISIRKNMRFLWKDHFFDLFFLYSAGERAVISLKFRLKVRKEA